MASLQGVVEVGTAPSVTGADPEGSLLGLDLGSRELVEDFQTPHGLVGSFWLHQEVVGSFRLHQEPVEDFWLPQELGNFHPTQNFGLLLLARHFDLHLELAAIF